MIHFQPGGDSKSLMFLKISPHENDVGKTLCPLNFSSKFQGLELCPTSRQQDVGEVYKYKYMVCSSHFIRQIERIRLDGKELKNMEDNLQTMEIEINGREQMCRNLQEKVERTYVLFTLI